MTPYVNTKFTDHDLYSRAIRFSIHKRNRGLTTLTSYVYFSDIMYCTCRMKLSFFQNRRCINYCLCTYKTKQKSLALFLEVLLSGKPWIYKQQYRNRSINPYHPHAQRPLRAIFLLENWYLCKFCVMPTKSLMIEFNKSKRVQETQMASLYDFKLKQSTKIRSFDPLPLNSMI